MSNGGEHASLLLAVKTPPVAVGVQAALAPDVTVHTPLRAPNALAPDAEGLLVAAV